MWFDKVVFPEPDSPVNQIILLLIFNTIYINFINLPYKNIDVRKLFSLNLLMFNCSTSIIYWSGCFSVRNTFFIIT